MEQMQPNFRQRYEELLFRINEAASQGPVNEGTELHHAVLELFNAVVTSKSEQALGRECGRLLNRFTIAQVMPEHIDAPHAVQTIYGVGSQYSDGDNSSCTSCAQAFLRNILPLGIAWDLTTEQVTGFIEMGKGLYFALLKQAAMIRQQDHENLGDHFVLHQAFSAHEISQQYGLHFMRAHDQRLLDIDAYGSTVPFFEDQLQQLEAQLSPERKSIGATIHCQEKTYALAIFDTVHGREFVFFDSHGNAELNNQNPNAYVKYTFDRRAMAQVLSLVMPFHPAEEWSRNQVLLSHQEGLLDGQKPEVVIARINRENNPYILYQMDVAERGVLAEVYSDVSEIIEDVVTGQTPKEDINPKHSEVEKTNYLAWAILCAAALVVFRNRLISIITSYTGKNGQKMLPPSPLSKSIKVQ